MGNKWTPPAGELIERCGGRFWQVRCGWCGVEVNAYTPRHFNEMPRVGRTGFHNGCWDHFATSMRTLASNLAVAAFGCLAFYYGSILDSSRHAWRPGCGEPVPGFDTRRPATGREEE